MPNLTITENYDTSLTFRLGANTPRSKWDIPSYVVSSDDLERILKVYQNVNATEKPFWFKDPLDFKATALPYVTTQGSFTHGCLASYSGAFDSFSYLYKVYSIPTSLGFKQFFRVVYRHDTSISPKCLTANTPPQLTNVSLTSGVGVNPTNASSYIVNKPSIPNVLEITSSISNSTSVVITPLEFEFYTLVRFTATELSYTPTLVEGGCSYYTLEGFSLEEVKVNLPNTIIAGELPFVSSTYPNASSRFNPIAPIK